MEWMMVALAIIAAYGFGAHWVSYKLEKSRVLNSRRWALNICCGKTDGGGINADIFRHESLPNFVLLNDIYRLPFTDQQFDHVLCSHTIEHVDDPERFYRELRRVGNEVTLVVPPLYDIFAVLNCFEHRHIFLTFKKTHTALPRHIQLPFSKVIQEKIGQINHA